MSSSQDKEEPMDDVPLGDVRLAGEETPGTPVKDDVRAMAHSSSLDSAITQSNESTSIDTSEPAETPKSSEVNQLENPVEQLSSESVEIKDNIDAMDPIVLNAKDAPSKESSVSTTFSKAPLPPSPSTSVPPSPPSKSSVTHANGSSKETTPVAAPTPKPLSAVQNQESTPPTPSRTPQISHRSSVSSMHSQKSSLSTLPSTSLSSIHLLSAMSTMAASKDAKRSQPLQKALATALDAIKKSGESGGAVPVEQSVILEPLRLACETKSAMLQSTALDCISKLVSHGFFHGEKDDGDVEQDESSDKSELPTSASASPAIHLADELTLIITSTYTESTPDTVALQIVKSLLALVLSSSVPVHHSSLLKAVRTVYNIFLLSSDPINQMVAQGGLTQMVHHVFGRIKIPTAPPASWVSNGGSTGRSTPGLGLSSTGSRRKLDQPTVGLGISESGVEAKDSKIETPQTSVDDTKETNGDKVVTSSPTVVQVEGGLKSPAGETPKITLSTYFPSDSTADLDSSAAVNHILNSAGTATPSGERPRLNSASAPPQASADSRGEGGGGEEGDEDPFPLTRQERFIKDAFLIFRALCTLTMKPLEREGDLKTHGMRSKLLALHLILTIVQSHLALFASPYVFIPSSSATRSTFVQTTKKYLCLSLIRNATSSVSQVFELCSEIFWNVLKGLRGKMKKEIEVLLNEIFLSILQLPTFTLKQKSTVLHVFLRLAQDPQALVEIYLNYDCDRMAILNVYEQLMEIIAKIAGTHFAPPSAKEKEQELNGSSVGGVGRNEGGRTRGTEMGPIIPPSLTTHAMSTSGGTPSSSYQGHGPSDSVSTLSSATGSTVTTMSSWAHLPAEVKLRRQALECLVTVLRSLVQWGTSASITKIVGSGLTVEGENAGRESEDGGRDGGEALGGRQFSSLGEKGDDPETFENAKQRKTTLMEGIKKFNFKPKKGIQFLIEQGFIRSKAPQDIARFLLQADGLSKAMIGEYMGEGDEENVAIMHCFVDMLDFRNMKFVDAVRTFLQSFRLPGESQKIDRYVLKFAERYIAGNAVTEFANADTAYILAFSVIMLNTDAHNKNLKGRRMTKEEFLRNNRGINDGQNLPDAFLEDIFNEIQTNEIKMKDEVEVPQVMVAPGLANTLANVGRDIQREAYVLQSEGMSNRTEALFKTMLRQQRQGGRQNEQYYSASHLEHVRPMFEVAWMPVLAALSGPIQETDEVDVVDLCLEGFKHAIRVACFFDLEIPRKAFVSTLTKFTYLNNLGEMKAKNVEAIKTLLEIAVTEGNYLKSSWRDVLVCVSQLERMQLISNGIDTPDIGRRQSLAKKGSRRGPGEDVASESRSAQVTVAADMVFSSTKHLSGSAIVEFVQALSEVSWEEIQSSSASHQPRLFSLQKLVEISYYNMARIRLEWSGIWQILGEHFNQVCCHNNPNVSFFALDALRQLAMRFLEKDELSHFQFQKDFLKPFEYTMIHNTNSDARDMVLQCFQQMLQARVGNMRSGWRTMFGVFSAASRVLTERVATYAFELVQRVNKEHFSHVVRYGAFADLTVCLTDFCKVSKFQKISLQAVEILRGVVPAMLSSSDCALSTQVDYSGYNGEPKALEVPPINDPMVKFWFPLLFAFYDVVMNGEDLEVRRVALDSLFDTLATHGKTFRPDFWDSVCQQVLFPIFAPLRAGPMQEDMSFWVSTTMLTALRKLIDLYTLFFEILERFLDPLLELLCFCIDQENDTLARIGTTCFQQLLESNVKKLSPAKWERIVSAFVQLFQTTLAHMLFDPNLRSENEVADSPQYASTPTTPEQQTTQQQDQITGISANDRRRIFRQIIRKCVLQLLLIETTHELLQNDEVYQTIPAVHLLRFLEVLDDSYQFARKFNADKDLRMALWKVGFMKQLPNLLKQESSSASTLVNNLIRMYNDSRTDHQASREGVLIKFVPLSLDIIQDFNQLEPETQARHIAAWSPVVCEILQGYCSFDDETFNANLSALYPLVAEVLARENAPEVRESIRAVLVKVGRTKGIC